MVLQSSSLNPPPYRLHHPRKLPICSMYWSQFREEERYEKFHSTQCYSLNNSYNSLSYSWLYGNHTRKVSRRRVPILILTILDLNWMMSSIRQVSSYFTLLKCIFGRASTGNSGLLEPLLLQLTLELGSNTQVCCNTLGWRNLYFESLTFFACILYDRNLCTIRHQGSQSEKDLVVFEGEEGRSVSVREAVQKVQVGNDSYASRGKHFHQGIWTQTELWRYPFLQIDCQ